MMAMVKALEEDDAQTHGKILAPCRGRLPVVQKVLKELQYEACESF
jgi:hypothetical protein